MAKLRVDKIAAPIVKDEFTGSVHFDGTGDYLSVADHSDLDFGTGDFTIEFWAYAKTSALHDGYVGKRRPGSFDSNSWRIAYHSTYDNINLLHADSGGDFTAAAAPAPGQSWSHYAFTRQSGTLRVFKDGVLTTSAAGWTYDFSNTYDLLIGANITSDYYLDGYISNLRICKGHAVYTGNFTVPTRELEVHTGAKGVVFPAADNRTVLLACQDAYNPTTEATGRHTITGNGHLSGDFGKNIVTNGDFTDGTTGWTGLSGATLSVENGKLKITESTGAADGYAVNSTAITTVVGVTYKIEWTFTEGTNTSFTVRFGNSGNQTLEYQSNSATGGAFNDSGTYSFYFTATGTQLNLSFIVNQASTYGYVSNVSVVAVPPISEANPGLLRKTNITSTITETTGSVYFDGTSDGLRSSPYDELIIGTGAFTIECWFWRQNITDSWGSLVSDNLYSGAGGWDLYTQYNDIRFYVGGVGEVFTVSDCYSATTWTHVAAQRDSSGNMSCYINGVEKGVTATNSTNYTDNRILIGGNNSPAGSYPNYVFNGYISNVRVCKGHNVYTSNFIPPSRELEVHPGPEDDRTILLACYDGENVFAEKTGKIIAATGDRLSSPTPTATDSPIGSITVTPGLTREVDPVEGPTFGGGAGFVSQNWLTLPKGTTAERMPNFATNAVTSGGTRAVYHSGEIPTTSTYDTLEYLNIATLGSVNDFGNLTNQKLNQVACSSNTRGLFASGYTPSPASGNNFIDYVTIMSTGNAQDFGDLTYLTYVPDALSNQIRGIYAGGAAAPAYGGQTNMDYVTISTLGNGKDFGDLTRARHSLSGLASPTRGVFAAGNASPVANLNNIDYVTIASTGNAQDFGDIGTGRAGSAGASSAIRGLFAGGYNPSILNSIDFITIASTGNTQDFGDLTAVRRFAGGTSSTTRGVFMAGFNPSATNTIDFVSIQTTGNATDFGDTTINKTQSSACSNGHGGLG